MNTNIKMFAKYLSLVTVFLLPLVFSPFFQSVFDTTKMFFLILCIILIVLSLSVYSLASGNIPLRKNRLNLSLLFLSVVFILSSVFVKNANIMEGLVLPGTTTLMLSFFVLFLILNYLFVKKDKAMLLGALFFSALTTSLVGLYTSTTGSKLSETILLISSIPLGIYLITSQKEVIIKIFYLLATLVVSLVAVYNLFLMLPGKKDSPRMLGYKDSWAITAESIKKSPLLGIGSGNFITAFNLYRPYEYNKTANWNTKFSSAHSFVLTAVTETGVLGLLALVLVFVNIARVILRNFEKNSWFSLETFAGISLILSTLSVILFPGNFVTLLTFFVILAINSGSKGIDLSIKSKPLVNIISVQMLVLAIIASYFAGRAGLGEYKYKKSIILLSQNDAQKTYDTLNDAIKLNPKEARYRSTFSAINLGIANVIAQNKDLTDEQKGIISQLVQQSISEAKLATSLNLKRSENWEALGKTYQELIVFAKGAEQFSLQSFNQAIALDPLNPRLRIEIGGVYYSLGDYENAIESFKLAVLAKPDLANAHYNLAAAYKENGDTDKAEEQLKLTLSLLKTDSKDYKIVQSEIENLKNSNSQTQEGQDLTSPPEQQEPVIEPQLELPVSE